MGGNFDFLRSIDKDLFEIINDAERLYRGEFFEQCIGQTRRFGEHLCRNVLGSNRTTEVTFDEMLATLKDKSGGSTEEKEFIEDLYFLKKQGNNSVHSSTVKQDGMAALKCLHSAFEAAINYAVFYKKGKNDILKLNFDTELLVTGKKPEKTLAQTYLEAKEKTVKKTKTPKNKPPKSNNTPTKKPKTKQVSSIKSVPRNKGVPIFKIAVGISLAAALAAIIYTLL